METKNVDALLLRLKRSSGFLHHRLVTPVGSSGGLALFWNAGISLSDFSSSPHLLDFTCLDISESRSMRISCIHAPWLCFGDFNEILHRWEKVGSRPADSYRLSSFREVLNDCSLMDLPSHGCAYTWSNNREAEALVKERLDRAVCTAEWRISYPRPQVIALPLKLSGTKNLAVNP